jgi:hypothetical protein
VSPQVKTQRVQIWWAWRPCSVSSCAYPLVMIVLLRTPRTAQLSPMVYVVVGLDILSCVGAGVQRWGLALSIWPTWVRFYLKTEIEPPLQIIVLNKKQGNG